MEVNNRQMNVMIREMNEADGKMAVKRKLPVTPGINGESLIVLLGVPLALFFLSLFLFAALFVM